MSYRPFEESIDHLASLNPEEAWGVFLDEYSSMIFQAVLRIEHDSSMVPDCFQFVCEKLSANSLRRLRKFRSGGSAKFSTWLRAVVRNLCLDWRRARFGRHRTFKSIALLSAFDQHVFRQLYELRVPFDEALECLRIIFPEITSKELAESGVRIEKELTANQRLQLDARAARRGDRNASGDEENAFASAKISDPAANPETQAILKERSKQLRQALSHLPDPEQLLILLRFEQELTLEQVAQALGLGNAQRAERQIKLVLAKLRQELK